MKLRRGGSRHRPQPARTRQACQTLASRVPFFAIVAYGFVGTYAWLYGSLPVLVEHLGMMLDVFCLVGFESLTLLATVVSGNYFVPSSPPVASTSIVPSPGDGSNRSTASLGVSNSSQSRLMCGRS